MPKKAYKKKALYLAFCRDQVVKQGLINQADGSWRRADSTKAQDNMMRHGYKLR